MNHTTAKKTFLAAIAMCILIVNSAFGVVPPPGTLPGNIDISPTGAATYTIPIDVPKGIGGIAPQLAITYSSQAGEGMLGRGWNLAGISAITRVGQSKYYDNNVTTVNFTATDRFALDGQRLLADANYGAPGCTYTKEANDFTEIKSFGGSVANPRPDYFTVTTTDGTIYTYSTKILVPRSSDAYMWLLTTMTNRLGNTITYNYSDIGDGQFTLNEINYSTVCKVQFKYKTGNTRTGYVNGVLFTQNQLLDTITTINNGVKRQYSFSYNVNKTLNQINYKKKIGNIYTNLCNPTTISWGTAADYAAANVTATDAGGTLGKLYDTQFFFGDFNGDGRTDIVKWKDEKQHFGTGYNVTVSMANADGSGFSADIVLPLPERTCLLRTSGGGSYSDVVVTRPGRVAGLSYLGAYSIKTEIDIRNINVLDLDKSGQDELIIPYCILEHFYASNQSYIDGVRREEAIQTYKYKNGSFERTDMGR